VGYLLWPDPLIGWVEVEISIFKLWKKTFFFDEISRQGMFAEPDGATSGAQISPADEEHY